MTCNQSDLTTQAAANLSAYPRVPPDEPRCQRCGWAFRPHNVQQAVRGRGRPTKAAEYAYGAYGDPLCTVCVDVAYGWHLHHQRLADEREQARLQREAALQQWREEQHLEPDVVDDAGLRDAVDDEDEELCALDDDDAVEEEVDEIAV